MQRNGQDEFTVDHAGHVGVRIVIHILNALSLLIFCNRSTVFLAKRKMDSGVEKTSIICCVFARTSFYGDLLLDNSCILSSGILRWIICIDKLSASMMLYGWRGRTISVAICMRSFATTAKLQPCLQLS